jgi:Cu/Ag efflux pump CusA
VAAACLMGWWPMQHLTLDAVPDLTDTQVIISSRWDRSPDIMADQVTYPIVAAMVGAPRGEIDKESGRRLNPSCRRALDLDRTRQLHLKI